MCVAKLLIEPATFADQMIEGANHSSKLLQSKANDLVNDCKLDATLHDQHGAVCSAKPFGPVFQQSAIARPFVAPASNSCEARYDPGFQAVQGPLWPRLPSSARPVMAPASRQCKARYGPGFQAVQSPLGPRLQAVRDRPGFKAVRAWPGFKQCGTDPASIKQHGAAVDGSRPKRSYDELRGQLEGCNCNKI